MKRNIENHSQSNAQGDPEIIKNHEKSNQGAQIVTFGAPSDPSTTNWSSKVQKTHPNVLK